MSEEPIAVKSIARRVVSGIVRIILWLVLLLLLAFLASPFFVVIEAPLHLLFGWLMHMAEVFPTLLANWRKVMLPAGCLVLAGVLIHRFVRRTLEAKGNSRRWRPTDTVAWMSLLLLGCGAAIALSGIVHQAVWLMGGPWIEYRGRNFEQTMAVNNARQVLLALYEFHDSEGHYPNSLRELEGKFIHSPKPAWVVTENGKLAEPFILLKPGGTMSLTEVEPLIVSPVFESRQIIVVGYSDNSVTSLPAGKLDSILKGGGKNRTETAPNP